MRKSTYRETPYPGIKQRIKDGKYIVTLDLGKQFRMNKKTGMMEMMQTKTTKIHVLLLEPKLVEVSVLQLQVGY